MKRLASFLMIGVLITSFTWSRASISDTKENLKTEQSVKIVKHDLKLSNQSEFVFVNQNFSDLDYVGIADEAVHKFPTKAIQNFSKTFNTRKQINQIRNPGMVCGTDFRKVKRITT